MFHNIQPVPDEPNPAPSAKKRWLLYAAAVVLVLILLIWFLLANTTVLDGVKRTFRYLGGDYGSIHFETYGVGTYALVDTDFAVATQGGVTLFSETGDTLGRIQQSFSNPALKSNGARLLIYDIGGTHFSQMDRSGKTVFEVTATGRIFDADLSSAGYSALLYSGEDSHACLDIYHPSGTLLYHRASSSRYLGVCAVSPDGSYAAAAAFGQESVAFTAAVQIFRTDSEADPIELALGSQMIYDLAFVGRDTVCAVAENGLYFYRTDGTAVGEYLLDGSALTGYSFGGDGFVALTLDLYESSSRRCITVLNTTGEITATADLDESPVHVSACGSYASVLTAQGLSVFTRELRVSSTTGNSGSYTNAYVRSDGTAVMVSAGTAELYIP